jgi:hypothetical protein
MMKDLNMSSETQRNVRTFCFKSKELYRVQKYRTMLQHLAPSMQNIVAKEMVLKMVKGLERSVLHYRFPLNLYAALAIKLQHQCFPPEEVFGQPRTLYVLTSGVVLRMAMVRCNGAVWGEDLLIQHSLLRQSHFVISFSHVKLQLISLRDLIEVLAHYPRELRFLRKKSARLAICRAVFMSAEYEMALRSGHGTHCQLSLGASFRTRGFDSHKGSMKIMHTGKLQGIVHSGSNVGAIAAPSRSDRHMMSKSPSEREFEPEGQQERKGKRKKGNFRKLSLFGDAKAKEETERRGKEEARAANWQIALDDDAEVNASYARKHANTNKIALLMRGADTWEVGDTVAVVKKGSYFNERAVVSNPNWEGRVQVQCMNVCACDDTPHSPLATPSSTHSLPLHHPLTGQDAEWGHQELHVERA